jgi:serine/threonine protein kinase
MGDDSTQYGANSAANATTTDITTAVTDHEEMGQSAQSHEPPVDDPPVFQCWLHHTDYDLEVENLYQYRPGGYHPVALGDVLDGRFHVVHKLGLGGYATVWLCHDSVFNKWRAVKIMMADKSTPDWSDLRALRLFRSMMIDSDVLAANHIQLPLEHFWLDGPNGRHLCFVLPFLAPRLSHVCRVYGHVPELMKDICFQMIEALKFIHSRGLCHGDFRPGNILFRLADGVDEWEEEAIMKLLGEPNVAWVGYPGESRGEPNSEPGIPAYLVEPSEMSYGSGACSSEIAVIDFGVSYSVSEPPVEMGSAGIPWPYAAPEEMLGVGRNLGFHTDVWALGVTIAKVRWGMLPFALDGHDHDTILKGVRQMERIMGSMPQPYRTAWKDRGGEFVNCRDQQGNPLNDDSWKDEAVLATVNPEAEELVRREREENGRSLFPLRYRLEGRLIMNIDDEEARSITAQAAANPGRLPTYRREEEDDDVEGEVQDASYTPFTPYEHSMPEDEINLMLNLFLKIFRWHPNERATLDQIANHEWFGDRNRRRPLWPAWSPSRARLVMTALIRNGADRTATRLVGLLERVGRTVSDAVGRWRFGRDGREEA